jgi:hypothetical protein
MLLVSSFAFQQIGPAYPVSIAGQAGPAWRLGLAESLLTLGDVGPGSRGFWPHTGPHPRGRGTGARARIRRKPACPVLILGSL